MVAAWILVFGAVSFAQGRGGWGQGPALPPLNLPADTPRVTALKTEAAAEVDRLKDFSQRMVDQIAHKGVTAGARVQAMTLVDVLLKPEIMAKYRDETKKFYFDPTKYKTYLEQLGIQSPTIKKDQAPGSRTPKAESR